MSRSKKYEDPMKVNLEAMYTASLLARQNAVVVSPPGYGKTKMSYHMARRTVGDGLVFLPLSPSTPPERITGPIDVVALKEGRLENNKEGTPYDPKARIVILDEFWRANEVVFDQLIHATNDVTRRETPVFWGTSNFVVKSKRTEALSDRFALWYYFEPNGVNVEAVVNSEDISTWDFRLPTFKEIEEVRKVEYTEDARKALVNAVNIIIEAIGKESFVVNNRRVEAWRDLLFRLSVFTTGKNTFKTVPDEAMKIIRYAYPATDGDEARKWKSVSLAVVDSVGVAIEQSRAITMQKFNQVVDANDGNEKSALMVELGQILAQAEEDLKRLGDEEDERVEQAILDYHKMFQMAASGKKIRR